LSFLQRQESIENNSSITFPLVEGENEQSEEGEKEEQEQVSRARRKKSSLFVNRGL